MECQDSLGERPLEEEEKEKKKKMRIVLEFEGG
jgi:hypothetical protein